MDSVIGRASKAGIGPGRRRNRGSSERRWWCSASEERRPSLRAIPGGQAEAGAGFTPRARDQPLGSPLAPLKRSHIGTVKRPLLGTDSRNHQPQPWTQGSNRHRRAESLHPRLAQLLQTQLHLQGGAGAVGMGQAAGEVVLLEARVKAALTRSHGSSRARAAATCCRWVLIPLRCTWRRGAGRMSQNEIMRSALNNRWLEEPDVAKAMADRQGVPDMRAVWIVLHYGPDARV